MAHYSDHMCSRGSGARSAHYSALHTTPPYTLHRTTHYYISISPRSGHCSPLTGIAAQQQLVSSGPGPCGTALHCTALHCTALHCTGGQPPVNWLAEPVHLFLTPRAAIAACHWQQHCAITTVTFSDAHGLRADTKVLIGRFCCYSNLILNSFNQDTNLGLQHWVCPNVIFPTLWSGEFDFSSPHPVCDVP
jgi:hypothetical protein